MYLNVLCKLNSNHKRYSDFVLCSFNIQRWANHVEQKNKRCKNSFKIYGVYITNKILRTRNNEHPTSKYLTHSVVYKYIAEESWGKKFHGQSEGFCCILRKV